MTQDTTRVVLAQRPIGMPRIEDFRVERSPRPEPGTGEAVIANHLLAIDPAIRGFLDDRPSYLPPVRLGETVRGMTLGTVIASRNPDLPEGAVVRALAGWASHSVLAPDAMGLERIVPASEIPIEAYLGALGPSGLTAWVGLHEIGSVGTGETVLVSAAAGAVGSVACQLALRAGARVIGIAGGAGKCARLSALGVQATIDRRAAPDISAALREAAPNGIDLFFDNVGGATLEAVLPLMSEQGRVVVCGMIGDYNDQDNPYPVRTLWQIVVKRLTLRGFLTYDHADRLAQASADLSAGVADGTILPLHSIYDGLEAAPRALIDMMGGRTTGKTLVRVSEAISPGGGRS